jgi:signal transduction histidine kinase
VATIVVSGRDIRLHPERFPRAHEPDVVGYLLAIAIQVPLAWRRRNPVHALAATMVLAAPFVVRGYAGSGVSIGPLILVYSLAAHTDRRTATLWGLAFAAFLTAIITVRLLRHAAMSGLIFVSNYLVFGTAWILGDNLRNRRALAVELRERAVQAEVRSVIEAREAVTLERTRIARELHANCTRTARELHDVVAHSMSVMVVQAVAARRVLALDPDKAAGAMEAIETTGRASLNEMRRILGVLRTEDVGDGEPDAHGERLSPAAQLAPQPGLGDLDALIAQCRAAGMDVAYEDAGPLSVLCPALSPALQLTIFRIVQESLTNVLKHAGPARAQVRVSYESGAVSVEVADDGRGAAADPATSGGHGVRGIRERVEVFGGTVRIGPRHDGGYRVHAVLPAEDKGPGDRPGSRASRFAYCWWTTRRWCGRGSA